MNVTCLCTVFRTWLMVCRWEKNWNRITGGMSPPDKRYDKKHISFARFILKKPRKRRDLHTLSGKFISPPFLPFKLNHIVHCFCTHLSFCSQNSVQYFKRTTLSMFLFLEHVLPYVLKVKKENRKMFRFWTKRKKQNKFVLCKAGVMLACLCVTWLYRVFRGCRDSCSSPSPT